MSTAGQGLTIVLDELHKLVLLSGEWVLNKVLLKEKYSDKRVEALNKAKKKFVVVQDKKGKKQIGEWRVMTKRYHYSQLGVAMGDWVMDTMVESFPINSKLSPDDLVKFFKGIEKKLTSLSALSSMLTFRIKMDILTPEELAKVDAELKKNIIQEPSESGRGRRRQVYIGPEVMMMPVVVNEITKDKTFKVIDGSATVGPSLLRGFGKQSELIILPNVELPEIVPKDNPFKKKTVDKSKKEHKKVKFSSDTKKHKTAKLA